MKFKTTLRLALGIATCGCASQLAASTIFYHFDVDTAALAGNPNAPFALDFQLTDGDGVQNSSAVLGNFNFNGSSGGVGSSLLLGGASGSLTTSISLWDSEFFNNFFQEFTSGGKLFFDLNITSTASDVARDGFAFGISSANDLGASFFDVFAVVDLDHGSQTLNTFSPLDGVTAAVRVPDTGGRATLPIGLAALGLFGFLNRERVKKLNA